MPYGIDQPPYNCSSNSGQIAQLVLVHYLLFSLGFEMANLCFQRMAGNVLAGRLQVGQCLVDDVIVTRRVHLGHDHLLAVGHSLLFAQSKLLGNPQTKKLGQAGIDLEFQLFVVLVLVFKGIPAIVQAHVFTP